MGVLLCGLASELLAASVQGYTRRDGTYVAPHQRTNPDGNPFNNYGFPGNYNPTLGKSPQVISSATWIDTMEAEEAWKTLGAIGTLLTGNR